MGSCMLECPYSGLTVSELPPSPPQRSGPCPFPSRPKVSFPCRKGAGLTAAPAGRGQLALRSPSAPRDGAWEAWELPPGQRGPVPASSGQFACAGTLHGARRWRRSAAKKTGLAGAWIPLSLGA